MSAFFTVEKRHRSPNWQLHEKQLLLELVEQHYNVVECKKLDGATLKRKEIEWNLIARKYNARTLFAQRTGKVLRAQWGVMRKLARRDERAYHATDEAPQSKNPLHDRIVKLLQSKLNDSSQNTLDGEVLLMQDDDLEDVSLPSCSTDSKELKFNNSSFDCKEEFKGLGDDDDSDSEKKKARPITSFSARDCRLLLHCVRQEKNVLFSNSPVVRKQKAWSRIARSFNRQSSTKRSPQELKKKFQNLKAMASRVNNAKKCFNIKTKSYEEMGNDNLQDKKIKFELKSESTEDMNFDNDDVEDCLDEGLIANSPAEINHDPLSNGITPEIGIGFLNHNENKEADKLKIQLLNYKLETAKLQRKRIEDAIESDKSERDLRALETSLRIRAARLEVMAAEMKLPPMHPALQFTPEETRAQQYLAYRNT